MGHYCKINPDRVMQGPDGIYLAYITQVFSE